jgi:hypothetical protein
METNCKQIAVMTVSSLGTRHPRIYWPFRCISTASPTCILSSQTDERWTLNTPKQSTYLTVHETNADLLIVQMNQDRY